MNAVLPMHRLHPAALAAPMPWGPYPGLSYGRMPSPSGVLPPPPAGIELQELAVVRQLNANRAADGFSAFLGENGERELWFEFARQYRASTGFVRGWAGTALMAAAMGVTALKTAHAKFHYGRLRPYQVDPSIRPVGPIAKSPAYPSGHASVASAAATTLGVLWPLRAAEFHWWANQVALSRVHGGMHFPSDVQVGAALGRREAVRMLARVA